MTWPASPSARRRRRRTPTTRRRSFPDAELKIYPSPDEYKLDLANGRLDAAIDDVVVLDEWTKTRGRSVLPDPRRRCLSIR